MIRRFSQALGVLFHDHDLESRGSFFARRHFSITTFLIFVGELGYGLRHPFKDQPPSKKKSTSQKSRGNHTPFKDGGNRKIFLVIKNQEKTKNQNQTI